jgi:hypothetical protein
MAHLPKQAQEVNGQSNLMIVRNLTSDKQESHDLALQVQRELPVGQLVAVARLSMSEDLKFEGHRLAQKLAGVHLLVVDRHDGMDQSRAQVSIALQLAERLRERL